MFNLRSELPDTPEELGAHVKALSEIASSDSHKQLFDHLYGCLSILDAKSASLLTFNSVVIAVFAIFISSAKSVQEWIVIGPGMLAILASSLLLLWVVWIHWSTTDHLRDPSAHAIKLLTVRRDRTIKYRLAWYFAVGALFDLAAFLVLELFR